MSLTQEEIEFLRSSIPDDSAYKRILAMFAARDESHEQLQQRMTDEMAYERLLAEDMQRHNRLLADMHQITLDLLNRRNMGDLLQSVVNSAISITDSTYAEISLLEGEDLVVKAATDTLSPLIGDRPSREEARLLWKAFDTGRPVVLDDYQQWPGRRSVYDFVELHAIVELPIIVGTGCVGVMSLGRDRLDYLYSDNQIELGMMLTRLVGLIHDNARLYEDAMRELNQRQRLERQALTLAAEQNRADVLSKFIRDASHEFRTPLSVLQTSMYLMNRATDPAVKARKAEQIEQQIMRINNLVDMLLAQAVVDSGAPLQKHLISIYTLLHGCIDASSSRAEENDLKLVLDLPPDLPPINADTERLNEALGQIIDNALRYTLPGGIIRLSARALKNVVVLEVADTGIGIAPEDLPHVFERFYRRDHAHTTPGFGLGLSIALRIIERHGGKIDVNSAVGNGTTFSITLPI